MREAKKVINLSADLVQPTSYGENPQQGKAGLYDQYTDDPLALSEFEVIEGSAPSYNNYADVDRMLQTTTHIAAGAERNLGQVPKIAVGAKHGNMCGAAVGQNGVETAVDMLDGDPRAIFGGSLMVNFPINEHVAETLAFYNMPSGRRLLDVIVAPEFTNEALETLSRKNGKLRALANTALLNLSEDSLDVQTRLRQVRGGFLAQQNYDFILDLDAGYIDDHGSVAEDYELRYKRDLMLAWAIGSTSNSNTITLVKHDQSIGNGVGQQDRVSAAELAVKRAKDAGHNIEGAVAYSDSFFPFPDGPQKLIDEGVSAILTSSGSVNDDKVFSSIIQQEVSLFTLPDSMGRGFYAH